MRLDQLSTTELLLVLKNKWHKLKRIEFPSISIQEEALFVDPNNIRYINNPCLEIQLLSVRLQPVNFMFIKDTKFESVKVLAVSLYPYNILFINKPSQDLVFLAISKEGQLLDELRRKGLFKSKNGNIELTEYRALAKLSKNIY